MAAATDGRPTRARAARKKSSVAAAEPERTQFVILERVQLDGGADVVWRVVDRVGAHSSQDAARAYKRKRQDEFAALSSPEKVAALDAPPHIFRAVAARYWEPEHQQAPELKLA